MTLELAILSVLLPPVAVLIRRGVGVSLVVNVLLTVFGFWVLGIIHALWVILE